MAKRTQRQVARLRNTIIAFVVVVAVVVIGYGTLYSTGVTVGEYRAGTHYEVIEDAPRRRPGQPVMVQEFFSYGCIHCRNFDPMLEDWKGSLPEGAGFERVPVAFSPLWSLLAQSYFALEQTGALEQNHDRLFAAIHDRNRQFLSPEMVADFVHGHGVSREQFMSAFDSPGVRRKVRAAERQQRAMQISSVPALVVDGRYRIGMDAGRKVALDVADHLVAEELSTSAGSGSD